MPCHDSTNVDVACSLFCTALDRLKAVCSSDRSRHVFTLLFLTAVLPYQCDVHSPNFDRAATGISAMCVVRCAECNVHSGSADL